MVKVVVDNSHCPQITRIEDDIHHLLEINLIDAIFGTRMQVTTIDEKVEILDIRPGWQSDEKIVFENRVRILVFSIF